ncbi:ferric reductase like transmembrane component-domain-containing protein [Biscogniauxia mediterranea]|nr:ferric reductase like transmembrane component-domain-containing protein [Biscogniauxia mediterranea]
MDRRHSMDDMDMDGMGGMSMSTNSFQTTNIDFAQGYWYFIAAVVGLLLLIRTINLAQSWLRLRTCKSNSVQYPTKPTTWYWQTWATLTAVGRELSYPQLYIPSRYWSWVTPPPMGRVLVVLVYWAVIIYMMTSGSIVKDAYYWERIGYRNAWVTVTQVPLLYLLASKTNVIGLITGISYERLNWLHRWVARTMFVTATVHGFHFWTEWIRFDMVQIELDMMPMVPYGLGAWGILLWMTITSFKPLRSMAYEIFVVQHVLAAIMFLWVVYIHVPENARYNVWFAIAAICLDRAFRLVLFVWQNVKLDPKKTCCKGGRRFGHPAQLSPVGDTLTVLTIKNVHFEWAAGQHLYLWLPKVGAFEAHPYTIATSHKMPETCICDSIQLVIRSHSGFSKRLNRFARKNKLSVTKESLTAFVMGPYGHPPRWDIFETLVLISASTGASFTLPILESVLHSKVTRCTKRVDFLLAVRYGDEIGFYHQRLHEALEVAQSVGVELTIHIAVTGSGQLGTALPASSSSSSDHSEFSGKEKPLLSREVEEDPSTTEASPASGTTTPRKRLSLGAGCSDSHVHFSASRPDVATFIRTAVEATGGETGVVVCGGQSLVAKVRTSVAKLSDERAVHKGTGAQGIHLHVEEYCF